MSHVRQTDEAAGRPARRKAFTALGVLVALVLVLFVWRPESLDLWIKAVHVIAVIAWMAGLLYLPRLFVYHADTEKGSAQDETFKVMERRLLKVIMNPAMMVAWVLGLWLAWDVYRFQGGWLWVKLAGVVGLTVVHMVFAGAVRRFAAGAETHTPRYWRMMNEVPTVLMFVIVIMVIVKPF